MDKEKKSTVVGWNSAGLTKYIPTMYRLLLDFIKFSHYIDLINTLNYADFIFIFFFCFFRVFCLMCVWIIKFKIQLHDFSLPKEINNLKKQTFKHEWYLHLHWVDYFPIGPVDYPDSTVDWDQDLVTVEVFGSNCHYCFDNNYSTMTMNWMPIDVEMVHWVPVSRPMSLMQVHLDTVDMEVVFVAQQPQQLDDNTYRQQTVVLRAALGQDTARSQCMVDHRRVFEMQHSFPLQPATLSRRPFVVSIWFCKNEKESKVSEIIGFGEPFWYVSLNGSHNISIEKNMVKLLCSYEKLHTSKKQNVRFWLIKNKYTVLLKTIMNFVASIILTLKFCIYKFHAKSPVVKRNDVHRL